MSIDDTLNLHREFLNHVGGDTTAAAMLTLAHRMGQQPAAKRKPPERDRLTPPEVAKRLGVSADTVRGWISSGVLKAVNVAGPGKRPSHRISTDALAEFEEKRTPKPAVARRLRKRGRPVGDRLIADY